MKDTDESSVALMSVNEFIIFFSEHIHGKGEGHGLGALEVGDKSGHLLLGQDEGNLQPLGTWWVLLVKSGPQTLPVLPQQ